MLSGGWCKTTFSTPEGRLLPLGSALGALTPGSPNLNLVYGLPQASGYGPLMLKRYADVTGIASQVIW